MSTNMGRFLRWAYGRDSKHDCIDNNVWYACSLAMNSDVVYLIY